MVWPLDGSLEYPLVATSGDGSILEPQVCYHPHNATLDVDGRVVLLYAFELLMGDEEGDESLTSHWKTD